eukprot:13760864-Heterocapsa_arctica.AAC.1
MPSQAAEPVRSAISLGPLHPTTTRLGPVLPAPAAQDASSATFDTGTCRRQTGTDRARTPWLQ